MRRLGYSFVSDKGYVAFSQELSEGAWAAISIKDYDMPDQMPALALLDAARAVTWKLRATWAIRTLTELLGGGAVAAEHDPPWDAAQRRLYFHLCAAAEDRDPSVQAAAARLLKALTRRGGLVQTTWNYEAEVDFGWHQIELTREGTLAADVEKVKLGPILKEIEDTTAALGRTIGRGPGGKKGPTARSERLRRAQAACGSTFSAIHNDIAWTIEHTPAGERRTLLEQLLSPFVALLDRFPPPSGPGTADATEEEADTADTAAITSPGQIGTGG
jgi:hypothetical protein